MCPEQKQIPFPPDDRFLIKVWTFIKKQVNLTIIVSLVLGGLGYYYFNTNNKNVYRDRQLRNRPNFIVEKIEFNHDIRVKITAANIRDSILSKIPDLDLKVTFHLKNEGNAIGNLIGQFYFDTTSISEVASKMIMANKLPSVSRRIEDGLFDSQMINTNNEALVTHTFRIQNYLKGVFIIHAFFLYENDDKQYFSSYYIGKFHTNDLVIDSNYRNDSIAMAETRSSISKYVQYDTFNLIPGVYTEKEKMKIIDYFENLRKNEYN